MSPVPPLSEWVSRLKPELNHLYYRDPRESRSGSSRAGEENSDLGWFCREHALHLHCLALLLGHQSEVCQGDFIIQATPRPGDPVQIVSVGETLSHAWCVIDGIEPVDVSPSVRKLAGGFTAAGNEIPALIGPPPSSAGFTVRCESSLSDADFRATCPPLDAANAAQATPVFCYNRKKTDRFDPISLLSDPYQLLCRPALGMRTFTAIHGADVFFAITAHLLQVATGQVKGFAPYREPDNALTAILKRHTQARKEIEQRCQAIQQQRAG